MFVDTKYSLKTTNNTRGDPIITTHKQRVTPAEFGTGLTYQCFHVELQGDGQHGHVNGRWCATHLVTEREHLSRDVYVLVWKVIKVLYISISWCWICKNGENDKALKQKDDQIPATSRGENRLKKLIHYLDYFPCKCNHDLRGRLISSTTRAVHYQATATGRSKKSIQMVHCNQCEAVTS